MTSTEAPQSLPPPYRPIVRAGDLLFCSGQLGVADGVLVAGGVREQLRQAVANLAGLLLAEGASLGDVVKTTVFLSDIALYDEMNDEYRIAFPIEQPARSAVAVSGLPRAALVEIEAWAYSPQS